MVHDARIIPFKTTHAPDHIRKWMGDSIARWEGDTLVVETTNFTDKTRFRGASEQLKVTERFNRADNGTLLYRFTVEDPIDVAAPVDRRVPVGGGQARRPPLRVRVPRRQLRVRGDHEGRAVARRRARGHSVAAVTVRLKFKIADFRFKIGETSQS